MFIPLAVFLYIYLALLVVVAFFAFFNLYHVVRFSFWGFAPFLATFFFLAASVIVLFVSFQDIKTYNWQEGFTLEALTFRPATGDQVQDIFRQPQP